MEPTDSRSSPSRCHGAGRRKLRIALRAVRAFRLMFVRNVEARVAGHTILYPSNTTCIAQADPRLTLTPGGEDVATLDDLVEAKDWQELTAQKG